VPTILNSQDHDRLWKRIESVTPASAPRWGRFTAAGMMAHLRLSAEMALTEIRVEPEQPKIFRSAPVKFLVFHVVPFPKGAPTAPALIPRGPEDLEGERARLRQALDAFVRSPAGGPVIAHPLFGPLSKAEWGTLTCKHFDHHLKQFGL